MARKAQNDYVVIWKHSKLLFVVIYSSCGLSNSWSPRQTVMRCSQLRTWNPNTHPAERSEKVHLHSLSYGPRWAGSPAVHPLWTCIAMPDWYLQWEQRDEAPDSSAVNRENTSKGKRNRDENKDRKEEKGSCSVSSWSPKSSLASSTVSLLGSSPSRPEPVPSKKVLYFCTTPLNPFSLCSLAICTTLANICRDEQPGWFQVLV